jgi:hypothetical protein
MITNSYFGAENKRKKGYRTSTNSARGRCLARLPNTGLGAFVVLLIGSSVFAAEHRLVPLDGLGRPLWTTAFAVKVSAPKGWQDQRSDKYSALFVRVGDSLDKPAVSMKVLVSGISSEDPLGKSDKQPMHSQLVGGEMLPLSHVLPPKTVETFTSANYGKLTMWEIRGAYTAELVTILHDHVSIEASIASTNPARLRECIDSLKELVRSIRIIHSPEGKG